MPVKLLAGAQLGPFRILAPLGAGGMGEVWRARDEKLGREVAIKVLPAEVASSAEKLKRFKQEARAASSLNHPGIVTVHEVGEAYGQPYLVMELVEGKTLRDQLEGGPLPVRKAIGIAAQIADGLAAAHARSIVHRDMKPENVVVTAGGVAKILDFGLARPTVPSAEPRDSTLSSPVRLTEPGTVVGTVSYMSPEQARGKDVDFRSDQFSVGSILYEMLTGKRPFRGASAPETLSAIISAEPEPVSALRPDVPPPLRWIVERCLAKDPEDRYAATKDLAHDLTTVKDHLAEIESGGREGAVARGLRRRARIAWSAAALAFLAALILAFISVRRSDRTTGVARRIHASINFPASSEFWDGLALSPDGSQLAFVAAGAPGKQVIWVRPLAEPTAKALPGTEDSRFPFWSPDSRNLGFFAPTEGKLKRIDLSTGTVQTVCDVQNGRGGAWSRDGIIVFSPGSFTPLYRVPAAGGTPVAVTKLDHARGEGSHRFPCFLPDGRHFVYLANVREETARTPSALFAGSLDDSQKKLLAKVCSSAAYACGYLLYVTTDHVLVAHPFDARQLRVTGEPVPIAEGATLYPQLWYAPLSASESGVLVHASGLYQTTALTWLDRMGRQIGTIGPRARYDFPRLSRDGRRIAVTVTDPRIGTEDIWIFDTDRGTGTRLTFDPASDGYPVWTARDSQIVFSSYRKSSSDVFTVDAARPGGERLLWTTPFEKSPLDVSPDGRFLLYLQRNAASRHDLWILSTSGKMEAAPFLATGFEIYAARFSPDGRFVAYQSDESGSSEIYVRPFPGPGRSWRVSTSGGGFPLWGRDRKELYYLSGDSWLMAVQVKLSPSFEAETAAPLFQLPRDAGSFDISPDGQRFLVPMPVEKRPPLSLVLNWNKELPR